MESFIVLAWMIKRLAEAASTRLPDLCNRLLIDVVFVLMVTEFGSSSLAKISTKPEHNQVLFPLPCGDPVQATIQESFTSSRSGREPMRKPTKEFSHMETSCWSSSRILALFLEELSRIRGWKNCIFLSNSAFGGARIVSTCAFGATSEAQLLGLPELAKALLESTIARISKALEDEVWLLEEAAAEKGAFLLE